MQPTIANSILPLTELKWARIFERVLKLSVPTLYGWIIIFYSLFHVWLNIVAELTRFGDREFYKVPLQCSSKAPHLQVNRQDTVCGFASPVFQPGWELHKTPLEHPKTLVA